jgi:hypothetical protein
LHRLHQYLVRAPQTVIIIPHRSLQRFQRHRVHARCARVAASLDELLHRRSRRHGRTSRLVRPEVVSSSRRLVSSFGSPTPRARHRSSSSSSTGAPTDRTADRRSAVASRLFFSTGDTPAIFSNRRARESRPAKSREIGLAPRIGRSRWRARRIATRDVRAVTTLVMSRAMTCAATSSSSSSSSRVNRHARCRRDAGDATKAHRVERHRGNRARRASTIAVRASNENPNPSVGMDAQRANAVLGLRPDASSDELVRAHKDMLEKYAEDEIKRGEVEAAYDVLLMKSFNRRTKGESVKNEVKYADVVPAVDKIKASLPPWAREAGKSLPAGPRFAAPSRETTTRAGALFGALALVTLLQGFAQPEGVENPTGLEIAAALGATVWFMNQKRVSIGRAAALAFGALVVGSVVGGAVQGWLRVDIVPFAGISSPSTIVSEFGILSLFIAAACLD